MIHQTKYDRFVKKIMMRKVVDKVISSIYLKVSVSTQNPSNLILRDQLSIQLKKDNNQ